MKNWKLLSGFICVSLLSGILLAGTYSGGDGTSGTPYQISNKGNLLELCNTSADWSKYFIQTTDIVFDETDFQSGGSFYNDGAGFSPIGNYSTKFSGHYNGDGHYISNLYIDRSSTSYLGLFGYIKNGAEISKLGIINCNITGDVRIGGLVGRMESSTVENCHVTGSITGTNSIGGLIGEALSYKATSNVVNKCYSMVVINGVTSVGGLVGNNYSRGGTSTISNCYGRGSVNATGTQIGGLVGINYSEKQDVYIGGNAAISKCYSTIAVIGSTLVGGLVGKNAILDDKSTATVSNSFWDTQTSGQSTSSGGGYR